MTNVASSADLPSKIDVVVVNWNSGNQLFDCIQSLSDYGGTHVSSVSVVDNASTDDSIERIKDFAFVRVIKSDANLGFAKACNLGAKNSNAKYLLFLNPDAAVFSDTLSKVLNFMDSKAGSNIGICGVQLIDEHGAVARSCARFPNSIDFVAHGFGIDKIKKNLSYVLSDWNHSSSKNVDHVIGAFFMVRRVAFDFIKGFDEDYFLYLEDLDFSLRLSKAGWKSFYFAEAQAFHLGGGTSRKIKAKRLFYSLRSRTTYAFKNFSGVKAACVCITMLLIEPFSRSALAVARLSWSGIKETWIAYGMLWRWIFMRVG